MATLNGLLDAYKAENELLTDRALAAQLGISFTALANYRAGVRKLPDRAVVQLADATGHSLHHVMALANLALNELGQDDVEFWADYLD